MTKARRNLRASLDEALDELASDDESIKTFVRSAFELTREKQVWATITCKKCHVPANYPVTVQVPDYRDAAKALEILLNQAKGKPEEKRTVDVNVTMRSLSELSDEDLVELAEWEPAGELEEAT